MNAQTACEVVAGAQRQNAQLRPKSTRGEAVQHFTERAIAARRRDDTRALCDGFFRKAHGIACRARFENLPSRAGCAGGKAKLIFQRRTAELCSPSPGGRVENDADVRRGVGWFHSWNRH